MLHSKKEIIKMVNLGLLGQISPMQVEGLDADDALFFWMMYSVGSCVMSGTLSKESANKIMLKVNGQFDRLSRKFKWGLVLQAQLTERRRKFCISCSRVSMALNSGQPNAEKVLRALTQALDLLTGDDVYLRLLEQALVNEDFKKDCQQAVIAHGDELCERFKGEINSEDYFHLLEDFYSTCVKDGLAGCYEDFGEQPGLKFEKTDKPGETADNIKDMYELRKLR